MKSEEGKWEARLRKAIPRFLGRTEKADVLVKKYIYILQAREKPKANLGENRA